MKHWYDGYLLANQHIYNPKAVINVLDYKNFQSYWSQTGSYEVVIPLINMDFDGLKTAIIEMLSGGCVEVDVTTFQNDTINFSNRNDVITYLIHLGYLAYDQQKRSAFIPNEEIRQELLAATRRTKWNKNAKTALQQIKERKYPSVLLQYTGNILLVGINYNKKTKVHECKIEEFVK